MKKDQTLSARRLSQGKSGLFRLDGLFCSLSKVYQESAPIHKTT